MTTLTKHQWQQMNEQRLHDDLREVWALVSKQPGISVRAIAQTMEITHARSRKLTRMLVEGKTLTRGNHNEVGTLRAPIPLLTEPYVLDISICPGHK